MSIRAPMGSRDYWEARSAADAQWFPKAASTIAGMTGAHPYDCEFAISHAWDLTNHLLKLYSSGAEVRAETIGHFLPRIVATWSRSNELTERIRLETGRPGLRGWTFELSDLDHYIWCSWLLGFALIFDAPDTTWRELVELIGEEGHDALIDRLVASRDPSRQIGTQLLHPKPYERLLSALEDLPSERPRLLLQFVDHWYEELSGPGDGSPYWYHYGDPVLHPLSFGSYSCRWCIEAAAAAKVFGIDDSLCLGHEHYPGDLLRPDGCTTHPVRHDLETQPAKGIVQTWLQRLRSFVKQAA